MHLCAASMRGAPDFRTKMEGASKTIKGDPCSDRSLNCKSGLHRQALNASAGNGSDLRSGGAAGAAAVADASSGGATDFGKCFTGFTRHELNPCVGCESDRRVGKVTAVKGSDCGAGPRWRAGFTLHDLNACVGRGSDCRCNPLTGRGSDCRKRTEWHGRPGTGSCCEASLGASVCCTTTGWRGGPGLGPCCAASVRIDCFCTTPTGSRGGPSAGSCCEAPRDKPPAIL